ncbi:MAG: PAS domain S-box protein, partial [Spirochaetota bacterium]
MNNETSNKSKSGLDPADEVAIISASSIFTLVVDRSQNILYRNRRFADEFPAQSVETLGDMTDDKGVLNVLYDCVRRAYNGGEHRCELWIPLPASGIRCMDFLCSHISWKNESAVLIEAVGVSHRKQVEENLYEEMFKYRTILDNTVDIYFMFDLDGWIVDTNFQAEHELGYSHSELLAMNIGDIDRNFRHGYGSFSADVSTYESALLTRDGESIPAEVKLRLITYVRIPYIIGFYRDVTERKRFELRLDEQEVLYRSIFNSSFDALFVIDENGSFIDVNPAMCLLTGYSESELKTLKINEFLADGKTRDHAFSILLSILAGASIEIPVELECVNRYGNHVWLEIAPTPIFTHNGDKLVQCVARDITRRKEAESSLLSAKRLADEENQAKTQFLENMSHEIRTPLNGIMGLSELLLEKGLNDEQQSILGMIINSAETMNSLIQDLLDFSRLGMGQIRIHKADFDLAEFIHNTCITHDKRAKDKGLELRCCVEPQPLMIHADRLRIGQIIMNLLSNAVQYTENGYVEIRAGVEKDMIRISVRDTGIGIPPEMQERIFKRYLRLDHGLLSMHRGAGLGLSIVKELAELMGGRIDIDSRTNEGSTFTVSFPFEMPKNVGMEPKEVRMDCSSLKGLKVLIGEDDPINTLFLKSVLGAKEMEVTHFENGNDILEAARRRYDVILLDISMPGLDGLDVARAIRSGGVNGSVPIIAITAHAFDEDIRRFRESGMTDVLIKPVSSRRLCETLVRHIE